MKTPKYPFLLYLLRLHNKTLKHAQKKDAVNLALTKQKLKQEELNMNNKIILMKDKDAARIATVTGWISASGRFYGDDEKLARWDGATHMQCQNKTHAPYKKNRYCIECHKEEELRRFNSYPLVEYKEGFIYCHDNDRFYTDDADLLDSIEHDKLSENTRLSTCSPVAMFLLERSYWDDVLPSEGGYECIPSEIIDAIDFLNDAIEEHGRSVSFIANNDRIDINQLRSIAKPKQE